MSGEFWRTIQLAMEKDNWTARLVVVSCVTAAVVLGIRMIGAAG
ncbi:hypothetical protein [Streptomyces niphimycinicus]|nr:hypothetical protein [Streptomyces niphimycinicus]